ncbi:heme o synthase [Paenibacillus protaetiae]|uniref:Protoheme IX farnesyltransferase n=1 Tax=Paenibacillus protaetiae TaxID=2509456 RepID=A0A4P6F4T4_9BACL|nr:heme o synthase [Paenibacillus protaetiae]QAY68197.1 protoheme IX farnesyltransferase [Paenibacillus protaetiae]
MLLKDLIQLTKPRLLLLNVVASLAGFWVASKWHIHWGLLIWMLIGTTLTIASACVINNYWDRELDKKMDRTSDRPLPAGRMTPLFVLTYGIVLGILGVGILFVLVNPPAGWLGLLGWAVYVFVYTMWLKRTSTWNTSIGGISGAMPPVIGYVAVTNEVDIGAWLLFAFLFLWQPAHFWSLAIRKVEEYRAAGFPMLPVVKGINRTKLQMIPYVVLLIPAGILFYVYDYVGIIFLVVSTIFSIAWSIHTLGGRKAANTDKWAKTNFMYSINYLMLILVIMIVDTSGLY